MYFLDFSSYKLCLRDMCAELHLSAQAHFFSPFTYAVDDNLNKQLVVVALANVLCIFFVPCPVLALNSSHYVDVLLSEK